MAQSKFSRRGFLGRTAGTLAYMGTPSIISAGNQAGGLPNLPHHKATAKRVIYLFQSGGPKKLPKWSMIQWSAVSSVRDHS